MRETDSKHKTRVYSYKKKDISKDSEMSNSYMACIYVLLVWLEESTCGKCPLGSRIVTEISKCYLSEVSIYISVVLIRIPSTVIYVAIRMS